VKVMSLSKARSPATESWTTGVTFVVPGTPASSAFFSAALSRASDKLSESVLRSVDRTKMRSLAPTWPSPIGATAVRIGSAPGNVAVADASRKPAGSR